MMNERTVIYIILSAILLYLYYKRGGITIFVAFVVVVAGTLFVSGSRGAREGMDGKKGENAKKNKTKDKDKGKDEDKDKDKGKGKDKDKGKDKGKDNDHDNTKNKTKKNSEKKSNKEEDEE